jgi:hypothetical protein
LEELASVSGVALRTFGTAQFSAYQWLQSTANSAILDDRRLVQRYALATFYYAMGGDGWQLSPGWLSESNECEWYSTQQGSQVCDSNNNIIEINLRGNDLRGQIPPELTILSDNLRKLVLASNWISGMLPSFLPQLSQLGTSHEHAFYQLFSLSVLTSLLPFSSTRPLGTGIQLH